MRRSEVQDIIEKRAGEIRDHNPALTAAQAFTVAVKERPILAAAYQRAEPDPVEPIEKAAPPALPVAIEQRAVELLRAEPNLTRPQAVAKAARQLPGEVYASPSAVQARRAPIFTALQDWLEKHPA